MLTSNSGRYSASYDQPSDLVRALLLIVLLFAEQQIFPGIAFWFLERKC